MMVFAVHMNRQLSMFYVLGILFQFICMFMFMGLFFLEAFDGLLASSLLGIMIQNVIIRSLV